MTPLQKKHLEFMRGAKTPPQRTWVGLNWNDLPETYVGDKAFLQGAKWAEAKLKEKNNG